MKSHVKVRKWRPMVFPCPENRESLPPWSPLGTSPTRLHVTSPWLAGPPRQHPEERFDVQVRARVAIVVEVHRLARGAAVARQAPEKRFDVRVRPRVPVVVE